MKVTGLKDQKRGKRINLEIDDEFCCGIDESLIIEYGLYVGKEVDASFVEKIKHQDSYQKCLLKAFDILAVRLNSEKEIKAKLLKKYEYPTVSKVIKRLKELRYLDDEVFAKSWAEARSKSKGAYLIKRELKLKGIKEEIIAKQFREGQKESELEVALALIEKKKFNELPRNEAYKKITSYLNRRGFDYDTIKKVLEK